MWPIRVCLRIQSFGFANWAGAVSSHLPMAIGRGRIENIPSVILRNALPAVVKLRSRMRPSDGAMCHSFRRIIQEYWQGSRRKNAVR